MDLRTSMQDRFKGLLPGVSGESVAVHKGRTTVVCQTTIRAESGKLAALVTQTQLVIPATP